MHYKYFMINRYATPFFNNSRNANNRQMIRERFLNGEGRSIVLNACKKEKNLDQFRLTDKNITAADNRHF